MDLVRSASKEKVFRVALLSLRNLLSLGDAGTGSLEYTVVEQGLPKAVGHRRMQVSRRRGKPPSSEYAWRGAVPQSRCSSLHFIQEIFQRAHVFQICHDRFAWNSTMWDLSS